MNRKVANPVVDRDGDRQPKPSDGRLAHAVTPGSGETPTDHVLAATPRTTLHRRPQRGHPDRATVDAILDEALVCHVGMVEDGAPVVIPTTPWRLGRWLYLHGSARSRLILHVASGAPVCVTVALVDGLVLARSAMRHSVDYRSVVLFGTGEAVESPDEKRTALLALIDKLAPGRRALVRPPDAAELAATGVVRIAITEGTAKIRSEPPAEIEKDRPWTAWIGTVPVAMRAGTPRPHGGDGALPLPEVPVWLQDR